MSDNSATTTAEDTQTSDVSAQDPQRKAFNGPDRRGTDRRGAIDRRSGLDRRRGPGRRRSEERRSAEEGEMTDEQFAFLMAVDEYKKVNNRPFPTWTEVLDIIKALGYRKVAEPGNIR
jgi:hypothetical protein